MGIRSRAAFARPRAEDPRQTSEPDQPEGKPKVRPRVPEQTFEGSLLRKLIEDRTPVRVRLTSNEDVEGTIEYYDVSFIRLTRNREPNLFIYKHDIKYLYEV
jgi:host factor-I protein